MFVNNEVRRGVFLSLLLEKCYFFYGLVPSSLTFHFMAKSEEVKGMCCFFNKYYYICCAK